jgi:DNA-binding MarR family transcriptional regulator
MEKGGLVERTASSTDRRYNIVRMTNKGRKLFTRVEPLYAEVVARIMSPLKEPEQKKLIAVLERIRNSLEK